MLVLYMKCKLSYTSCKKIDTSTNHPPAVVFIVNTFKSLTPHVCQFSCCRSLHLKEPLQAILRLSKYFPQTVSSWLAVIVPWWASTTCVGLGVCACHCWGPAWGAAQTPAQASSLWRSLPSPAWLPLRWSLSHPSEPTNHRVFFFSQCVRCYL